MTKNRTLPEGWRWVRLGDVVRQVKETTKDPASEGLTRIVGLEHLDSESLPLRRWHELDELSDGTSFTCVFRAGQVLFGKRRAYQRKVAVTDFDGVCSGDILVFESSGDEMLAEFLPYLVQSDGFFDQALGTSAGSLSPRTKWQELAKYEFALPPEAEQRELVALPAAADGTLRAHESACEKALSLAEAVLEAAACSAEWAQLSEILVEPPRNGYTISPSAEDTGFWSLTVGSASLTGYSPQGLKSIAPPANAEKYQVVPGDLFVTRSNTIERVGFPLRVPPGEPAELYYSDLLMRLRPNRNLISERVLENYLRSRRARVFMQSIAAGTSASMKKINARNLKRLPVPIFGGKEAERLESHFDLVETLMTSQSRHLASGLALRKDLQRDVFHV